MRMHAFTLVLVYTVPATAVRTSAVSTGCLSSCFYASVSASRPVSKQQKLSAPSISILQFTIMMPCALCYIMMPGALCTTIITITLSISSTGVSTGCLSSNYLSATDSVRTAVAGTVYGLVALLDNIQSSFSSITISTRRTSRLFMYI